MIQQYGWKVGLLAIVAFALFRQHLNLGGMLASVKAAAASFWPSGGSTVVGVPPVNQSAPPVLDVSDDTLQYRVLKKLYCEFDEAGNEEGKTAVQACVKNLFVSKG